MPARKSSKNLGSLDKPGDSTNKQQSKSTQPKNGISKRRPRATHGRSPNIDFASKVVSQAVAGIDKLENSKPQAKVADSQSVAGEVKKKAKSAATPKRKRETTSTRSLQTRGVKKKATAKRPVKRDQSPAAQAEVQPIHKKTAGRKNQRQARADKATSNLARSKTESTHADTSPKKTPSKTRKRTPQKKSAATSKERVESTPVKRKRTARVKRKHRKTRSNTVVQPAIPQPVERTTDHVIGFQGIYYKPYQLTNRDLFMSGAQQDHFMDILTRAKEKLLSEEADRASQLQENDASNLPDPLDQGTNEGVFHNQLRTRDRESQLVRKINRAIDCLKTGSYGYCEACGCEIPIRRLEARPIVTKCIDCKERDELRERQLGQ